MTENNTLIGRNKYGRIKNTCLGKSRWLEIKKQTYGKKADKK